MHKFEPLFENILVEREEAKDTTTPSGIFIPETATDQSSNQGKVVAVGPGKRLEDGEIRPLTVKVGDTVVFGKYAGNEVEKKYLIIKETDVLARIVSK